MIEFRDPQNKLSRETKEDLASFGNFRTQHEESAVVLPSHFE